MKSTPEEELRRRLRALPQGHAGWKALENAATDALTLLFVPPLQPPVQQARSYSGIDRRDAVFANRNHARDNAWGQLLRELDARMVLFEFKNYDSEEVGKDEVNQTRNYLTQTMGRFAVIVCRRTPNAAAHIKRNSIFKEDGKVILFLKIADLEEMLYMKERSEEPADFILDALERFYLEYE